MIFIFSCLFWQFRCWQILSITGKATEKRRQNDTKTTQDGRNHTNILPIKQRANREQAKNKQREKPHFKPLQKPNRNNNLMLPFLSIKDNVCITGNKFLFIKFAKKPPFICFIITPILPQYYPTFKQLQIIAKALYI